MLALAVSALLVAPALGGVSQQAKLTAADGAAFDEFGHSVAVSGDTAVVGVQLDDVGANVNQGSAYVFTRSGSSWTLQAKLTAADGAVVDFFGSSVAADGDTVVVGAPGDDVGPNQGQGSAYVFTRSGSSWSQQAKLTASDGASADELGGAVAVSGDIVVIGASGDDVGVNSAQGSAYAFARSGFSWSQQAKLTASDGAASDIFGYSVAVSGETAVIGAYLGDIASNGDQGAAYVFTRSGSSWSQQAKLTASDGAASEDFGISVAASGDTTVIGAHRDTVGANTTQGSAYVFIRSGSSWTEQAKLTAADGAADDSFGYSVAVSGDTAVVGAVSDDVGVTWQQGSAYVFTRSGSNWSQQARPTAADGAFDNVFGTSVAVSGDTMVVGAPRYDVGSNMDQGSAYVFTAHPGPGTPATLELTPFKAYGTVGSQHCMTATLRETAGSPSANVTVRFAVAGSVSAGGSRITDANGQGSFCYTGPAQPGSDTISAYADVDQSGARDTAEPGAGASMVWVLPEDMPSAKLTAPDGADFDGFGYSVAMDGDTLVVGMNNENQNQDPGAAYVFVRSGSSWSLQAKLTVPAGAGQEFFGWAVAVSGDTAVIGAPYDSLNPSPTTYRGAAFVFTRNGSSWTHQATLAPSDGANFDEFGKSVAVAGDTAVVGAPASQATGRPGAAYAFTRSGSSWSQQAKVTASDGTANDAFGNAVALEGDRAVVGAYRDGTGSAYVFTRSGSSWNQQVKLTASDGAPGDNFGSSLATSGGTVVVGAFHDNFGANTFQGSAYVFIQSGSSWSQQAKLTAVDGAKNDSFGNAVAVDGDRAIVGAFFKGVGANFQQGLAYVFTRTGATWHQQKKLAAPGGERADHFGISVELNGDTAVVGAYGTDMTPNADQGAAYVYGVQEPGYPRPKGATPLRVPLVPAAKQCTSPNSTHGAPLSFPSCTPPVPETSATFLGIGDGNPAPAKSIGHVQLKVLTGTSAPDDADVAIAMQITNVMHPDRSDYTGELLLDLPLRITDRLNGPYTGGTGPATVADASFKATVPCAATADTTIGGLCATATTANAILPGAVPDGARSVWELRQVKLYDGGPDEDADTAADNGLLAVQGVFVP
jgi:FG-GAP repeat protein